jgi:uncharacterized membrane protein
MIMDKHELDQLLSTEDVHLQKLHSIVLEAIEEENLMSQKLAEFEERNPSFSSKLADRLATFGGSWKFIVSFAAILAGWAVLNVYLLSKPFDPFPFIFLNLVLSCLAALQAPLIMMSQNRKETRDRQRAINDYLVNLKAEIEIRNIHQKLDLLISEQMKTLFEIQKVQMEMIGEVRELLSGK